MVNSDWAELAYSVVLKVAKTHSEFTPDDIWEAGLSKPTDARALGGVMSKARARNIIRKSGRVQPTRQPESHGTDVTVWESLIFSK